jgi:photosystem II stability/assembly factor-like uncharacterized protein
VGQYDRGRFTTHKLRAEWFKERTSYPRREVYPPALGDPRPTGGSLWMEIGPPDIGGRLTSIAVHPRNPDLIYVGAAGGGVWRSQNAGVTWKSIWSDQSPTLNIGSIALDPGDPKTLYAGTGEANLTADNYPGIGLFRYRARGWKQLATSDVRVAETAGGGRRIVQGVPRRIGAIAVDPFRPDHILIAGVTHTEAENGGLFETRDGGAHWQRCGDRNSKSILQDRTVFISGYNYWCHDVVFHPDKDGLVFATVQARGTQSGIWLSRDAGESWTQVRLDSTPCDRFGRTSLAVARGSKTVYALAAITGGGEFLGVFRSDDLGRTWKRLHSRTLSFDAGLSYTNCIAQHPEDPMTAVAGSVDLHLTRDGGAHWSRISRWDAEHDSPRYAHADHHALAIIGQRIYSATDGGLAVSEDLGRSWEMRNQGLAVSMFYDIDVAATNSRCMGGGIQDNGTWFAGPLTRAQSQLKGAEAARQTAFRPQLPGDGGWTLYDPDDETHIFASAQRMQLFRRRGGRWKALKTFPAAERAQVWMAILAMDWSDGARRPRALYVGSNRVWKSTDDGDTWKPVSPALDGSVITAIEVAPADPRCVYAGTMDGGFFRSVDAGRTWSMNLAGPGSPGRTVTRIESYAGDAGVVYFTVGVMAAVMMFDEGYRTDSSLARGGAPFRAGDRWGLIEFRHLYGSYDGGDTWFDPDLGGLPNLPHQAVVITPGPKPLLCVGHDAGVMAQPLHTRDDRRWFDVSGNLPRVRVTDLVCHEGDGLLVVATYGRGLWRIPIASIEKALS